jgi:hypothetical protein
MYIPGKIGEKNWFSRCDRISASFLVAILWRGVQYHPEISDKTAMKTEIRFP